MKLGMTKWLPPRAGAGKLLRLWQRRRPSSSRADPPLDPRRPTPVPPTISVAVHRFYLRNDRAPAARAKRATFERSLSFKPSGDAHYYLGLAKVKLNDKPGAARVKK
jgi:hypothetical protein